MTNIILKNTHKKILLTQFVNKLWKYIFFNKIDSYDTN